MKKRLNSRSKGNRFENQCCKLFEELIGHPFRKTRGSGAGVVCGDIAPYSENQEEFLKWTSEFPFTIEAKNNEYMELHHLLVSPKTSFIWKSWEQAVDNAKRTGKIPFLLLTKNHFPILCMTNWSGWGEIIKIYKERHNINLMEKNIIFTFYDSVMGTNTTYWIFQWKEIKENNEV